MNDNRPRLRHLARISFAATTVLILVGLTTRPRAQSSLNLVYVESNIGSVTNGNSIFGFSNDGSGNLTALPGSPYLTEGTGVYVNGGSDAFDGDQQVIASPDSSLLFAVNGHSNTVSVFSINSDGTLTPVSGSPFASGGLDPISVGVAWQALPGGGSAVIVVNKDADPNQNIGSSLPNYTNFTTDSSGVLTPVPNGTINLLANSLPSQAYVPLSNPTLIFCLQELEQSLVTSYSLQSDGSMTQVSTVGPLRGQTLLGEWSHPTQSILYVGDPIPPPSAMDLERFTSSGSLSSIGDTSNPGHGLCWLRVNNAGTYLYSAETISGTLSVYSVTQGSKPTVKQHIALPYGGHPTNLSLDPTQKFLYVLAGTDLHVLNILSNGMVSETVSPIALNVPSGNVPLGVAVAMK